jgi:hypothetical protein
MISFWAITGPTSGRLRTWMKYTHGVRRICTKKDLTNHDTEKLLRFGIGVSMNNTGLFFATCLVCKASIWELVR